MEVGIATDFSTNITPWLGINRIIGTGHTKLILHPIPCLPSVSINILFVP